MRKLILPLLFPVFFILCSCYENRTAVLWTDRPEFVFYAELFNASQEDYKVEARYLESPSRSLAEEENLPDIAAAAWLKSSSSGDIFSPLESLFDNGGLVREAFYPRLLELGNIDGWQYLLPVSFNIPALIFDADNPSPPENPFTISPEEIKELGKVYNLGSGGVYTRMGFSPIWSDEFLFIMAMFFNAGFREASPLAWDQGALERAMNWVREWIEEANTSVGAEEDFAFKYLYDPPASLVSSGRILFAYMDSADFFTLPGDTRAGLDFRWIASNESIPLDERDVFFGMLKTTKAREAALAFTQWFFNAGTQRALLETSRERRIMETSFGIAGGFSAMRTVTEQVFPRFYPGLLGHMPPEAFLSPQNILPRNWTAIKQRIILPYLHERIRLPASGAGNSSAPGIRSLEQRVNEWYRNNRPALN